MSASYPPLDTGVSASKPSPAKLLLSTTGLQAEQEGGLEGGADVGPGGGLLPFPGLLREALGLHREQGRPTAWAAVRRG